jgi:Uma2 family endonuclease
MSTIPKTFLTPEQYLEIERKVEYKSEYYAGEMFAMSGASLKHNRLTMDLSFLLYPQVEKHGRQILANDMRVRVSSTGLYTYPDVIVVCGQPQLLDDSMDTLLNPIFLAEVLSPSTEAYDRGRKSEHYRKLESLREYLLIAHDRLQADLYTLQPSGRWELTEASQKEDVLELRSIDCRVSMAELYRHIELQPAVS